MKADVAEDLEGGFSGVSTDTRYETEGSLFFALRGENADGHDYVRAAFDVGARAAVVARLLPGAGGPQLVVPDTLQALGDLAAAYRRRFSLPVVGVTGSVGKTSTREMTAAALRARLHVLTSLRNFNNEIGVPQTCFALDRSHQAAVLEMGMRGLGQIDRLAQIAQPTLGVITNIGYAHLELLGSQRRIAEAKSELLVRLPPGGVAVLPQVPVHRLLDDAAEAERRGAYAQESDCLGYLLSRVPSGCRILTFYGGESEQAYREASVAIRPLRVGAGSGMEAQARFGTQERLCRLQAAGESVAPNAAAALAVALALSVPPEEALAALEEWKGAGGRMTVRSGPDGITVLDDCYNAGPESMAAALASLSRWPEGSRVAVLGDMKELGDFALEAHRFVGRRAAAAGIRVLLTAGALAAEIAEEAARQAGGRGEESPQIVRCETAEEAAQAVAALVRPHDTVLVKGSRAMTMEQIVTALLPSAAGDLHA